jgi:hypothetical protein
VALLVDANILEEHTVSMFTLKMEADVPLRLWVVKPYGLVGSHHCSNEIFLNNPLLDQLFHDHTHCMAVFLAVGLRAVLDNQCIKMVFSLYEQNFYIYCSFLA